MKQIGQRMKDNYEGRHQHYLIRRIPVILRLDGKAFHTYTRPFDSPFDNELLAAMESASYLLSKEIQGVKCAYIQSDEVSFLITDYDRLNTEAWLNYNIQKMTSISASIFTSYFNREITKTNQLAHFDARVFNIPREEVVNYFIWRQKDWHRNSISAYTRAFYSHSECKNKNLKDMHEMLYAKGKNWATDLHKKWKDGVFIDFMGKTTYSLTNFNEHRDLFNEFIWPENQELS